MSERNLVHFSDLPVSRRIVFTCAFCILGFGYLAAMTYIFISHAGRDGKPMISVNDVAIAYAGSKSGTRLESALQGPMSKMLPADENLKIVAWVRKGTDQTEFENDIGPNILEKRCVVCHNNNNPHLPSLEGYDNVKKVAEKDEGFSVPTLIRVSHIHLFGLTFIFFIATHIFSFSFFRQIWLKGMIIVIPYLSIALDISAWYITKIYEPFAWVVIGSGAAMGSCFGLMALISLYQMWFYTLPEDVRPRQ